MTPHKPEDWPRLFEQSLNAGDLDRAVSLYEPGACFVPKSGDTVEGREAIRDVLAGLIERKARLRGRVVRVIPAGEIAVLYTDWQGTTEGPSGAAVEEHSRAIEVLRHQTDDTWKLIVGDPNGRG